MSLAIGERKALERYSPHTLIVESGHAFISQEILNKHIAIANAEGVKDPYFNFTKGSENFYHTEEIAPNLTLKIGNIDAFDSEVIACFLENAIRSYEEEGTMGDFPVGDRKAERELTAAFIEGFGNNNWSVIMIDQKLPDGSSQVIGGCLVVLGNSQDNIKYLIGQQRASLSTLSALRFELDANCELVNTPEKNVVGVTRLFSIADKIKGLSDKDKYKIFCNLINGIDIAVSGIEKETFTQIKFGIADISKAKLLNNLKRYGWNLISSDTTPTETVMDTIFKYHYRYFSNKEAGRSVYAIAKTYQHEN